jgi:hypothetical protein
MAAVALPVIPGNYQNLVRLDRHVELRTYGVHAIHNYEVLTSYVNTRNGELRLDKDGYLYVLTPICWIFQSVIHFFIKWYREGWSRDASHPHRLEQAVKTAIEQQWTTESHGRLSSFTSRIAIAQRAIQARPEAQAIQGPEAYERRLAFAMQEIEERKADFKNQFCRSILSALDIASKSQDIAPSYVPILRAGDYAELTRELTAGRIPAQNLVLRGFLPPPWIPVIEQIVL